ncbi:MAG: lycopene cyclase domain-containing protein [Chitinophagales bacterium]
MNIDHQLYYLLAMLFSVLGPFALSFDKKVNFKQYFKFLMKSIPLVAIFFMAGDIFYTQLGVWGFNPSYHLPFKIYNLPIEEISFFLVVPYACIFIYECLRGYFKIDFGTKQYPILAIIFVLMIVGFVITFGKLYTSATLLGSIAILGYIYCKQPQYTSYLLVAYLISIIPFMMVNGFLTGCCLPQPIVWYNDFAIVGIRAISIPIEDFSYSFNLISLNIMAFEYFKSK